MSHTLTESGRVLTETVEGVTMPVDYSFESVNDFINSPDATYETMEALALGMACHIDKMTARTARNLVGVKTMIDLCEKAGLQACADYIEHASRQKEECEKRTKKLQDEVFSLRRTIDLLNSEIQM